MNFKKALDVELGPDQSLLVTLDQSGDTKIVWSRNNPVEVEIARDAFNKARSSGYAAYKMGADNMRGEVIGTFDPTAEKIILAPPLKGGI